MTIRHVPGQSTVVAQRCVREVPGFGASEEYEQFDNDDRNKPSLVFAALAQYLLEAPAGALERAVAILEDSASSDDEELHNYIVTEVFETWHSCEPKTRKHMKGALGPQARKLYDKWMNMVVPKA